MVDANSLFGNLLEIKYLNADLIFGTDCVHRASIHHRTGFLRLRRWILGNGWLLSGERENSSKYAKREKSA
jgi:hypothetical protein